MDDVSGVVQNPATIEQVQQVPGQKQQGETGGETGGAAADTVTLSQEGLQRSQAVGQAEAANENRRAASGQETIVNSQNSGPPTFLDIRV